MLLLLLSLGSRISNLVLHLNDISPELPELQVVEQISNLQVEREVRSMYCLDDGKVDYVVIDLFPKGDAFPYEYTVQGTLGQIEGPFTLVDEHNIVNPIVKTTNRQS